MNYINPNQQKIKDALVEHIKEITKKINVDNLETLLPTVLEYKDIQSIKSFLTEVKIQEILESKPKRLHEINKEFYEIFSNYSYKKYTVFIENINKNHENLDDQLKNNRKKYKKLHAELNKIFSYKNFTALKKEYNAYKLAKSLDINTCPYCNRMYTKTVVNKTVEGKIKKITRPEFDHWYPKSKYPLLALSFYNLIPSCHICNSSVKGDADFSLETHIHPYVDEKINMQYSYEYDKSLTNYKFKIKYKGDTNNKAKTTAEEFKLKEIYETHEDEINDLLRIKSVYSDTYLQKLDNLLGETVSYKEIYRLAFGTSIEESKFDKRPLSRMKRDILKELDIIKNGDDEK